MAPKSGHLTSLRQKNKSSLPRESFFFCYARMVRHDDARRWIFLFIRVVMAPGHPHKKERNFASVTLHVKAEFYCHLFL